MNQAKNHYSSWTSEQRLKALGSEMLTQVEIIIGNAAIAKKHLNKNNAENDELLICIKHIEECALYLKKLRNDFLSLV